MRLFSIITLCIAIAGCSSIPLSTMYKMRNFDPLSADPSEIQVAVQIPNDYAPPSESVTVHLAAKNTLSNQAIEETFVLDSTNLSPSLALKKQQLADSNFTIFWFNEQDQRRMRNAQSEIRRMKEEAPKNVSGSFSVNAKPCRMYADTKIAKKVLMSTYLKVETEQDFIPLTRNVNLAKQMDFKKLEKDLPICPNEKKRLF